MNRSIVIFGGSLIILAVLINAAANWVESKPSPPERKFDVVDKYDGCDVVRYTPDHSAKYAYFLNCNDPH